MKKIILIGFLLLQNSWLLVTEEPPTTVFCHGIVDTKKQADRYELFLQQPAISFNFPDTEQPTGYDLNSTIFTICSLFGKPVNRNCMYMGHGLDIQTLKEQITSDKNYILYGVSRGGATAISYMAQHNPDNVQALVVDAAPADVVDAIDLLQHGIGFKFAPTKEDQEYYFNKIFPAYPQGSTPVVEDIANIKNKELPIFIVHAYTDSRVHIRSAWQLYQAFKQAGFTNTYLCELQEGKHAFYMDGPDCHTYLHALHSFYKAHGFEFNPKYATLTDLTHLQPNLHDITEKLYEDRKQIEKRYEHQKMLNIQIILSIAAISYYTIAYDHTVPNKILYNLYDQTLRQFNIF